MAEPVYSFTLPSLDDDLPLDCRIYHPGRLDSILSRGVRAVKGAVLAHPYAPLGGCYDDHAILALTETLLEQGYIVATFNFRGAGGSQGKTSWSGRAEIEDYTSIAGFLLYYVQSLVETTDATDGLSTIPSGAGMAKNSTTVNLILGGYSYGSLVLARLPPPSAIVTRFHQAPLGTAGAEINLRARTLARQTALSLEEAHSPTQCRDRSLKPEDAATSPTKRAKASPVIMGGEETDPSERRRSRDSRRSVDIVRKSVEVPKRIKAHIRRRSDSDRLRGTQTPPEKPQDRSTAGIQTAPAVIVAYLLISPLVIPFTTTLLPPGPPTMGFAARRSTTEGSSNALFLHHPTLAVFGTDDAFTSRRRLQAWAEKQATLSQRSDFEWWQVDGAGHFWNEQGVLEAMQERVEQWTTTLMGDRNP